MPGQLPKDEAIRPALGRFRHLPAEGRKGRTPAWPLSKYLAGEKALWTELWRKPQAVVWEEQGLQRIVARYVRTVIEAEWPGANATLRAEVRNMEDRLMLNPVFLRRAYYVIGTPSTSPGARPTGSGRRGSAAAGWRGTLELVG